MGGGGTLERVQVGGSFKQCCLNLVSKEELHEGNVSGCLITDESLRPTTVPGIK